MVPRGTRCLQVRLNNELNPDSQLKVDKLCTGLELSPQLSSPGLFGQRCCLECNYRLDAVLGVELASQTY